MAVFFGSSFSVEHGVTVTARPIFLFVSIAALLIRAGPQAQLSISQSAASARCASDGFGIGVAVARRHCGAKGEMAATDKMHTANMNYLGVYLHKKGEIAVADFGSSNGATPRRSNAIKKPDLNKVLQT